MENNIMDNKDLVFSIYVVDTPNGRTPAVVQHKNTNLLELEVILSVLKQSVDSAKMNYVIKMPQDNQPVQAQHPPQRQPNSNNRPEEIDIQQIPEEYEEYQETGTPDD